VPHLSACLLVSDRWILRPLRRFPCTGWRDAFRVEPHDIRKIVQTTAPIVGSIGGFVVPAVALVLIVAPSTHRNQALLGLTSGLLALALIGCLVGAFALGSLAGEGRLELDRVWRRFRSVDMSRGEGAFCNAKRKSVSTGVD
jgi:hypothetical protein